MICLICSGFRIGVVSEDVAPPCSDVAAIVFCIVSFLVLLFLLIHLVMVALLL